MITLLLLSILFHVMVRCTRVPLPAPTHIPDDAYKMINATTLYTLSHAKWKPVKIAGLREQILDAQINGINAVMENIAPGFTNVGYDLVVQGNIVTMILDLGGVIRSTDSGKTWKQLSYNIHGSGTYGSAFSVDFSPKNTDLIIFAASYLGRSADGGKTWSEIYSPSLPEFFSFSGYNASLITRPFGKVRFTTDGSLVCVFFLLQHFFTS